MAAPKQIQVTLSESDVQNLVAFGNRAQMNGAEADTWVDLKQRLARAVDPGPDGKADATPIHAAK